MTSILSEKPLSCLLYTSKVSNEGPHGILPDARAIALNSAKNNADKGITGCLLKCEDSFIQLLEGPPEAVEFIFERICRDFRHTDVDLIDLVGAKERMFPDWGMAFLGSTGETNLALRDQLEDIKFLSGINAHQAIQQMRALFLEQSATQIEPV